jgi:predicted RNA-binding protein YlqC (UPF0109 family)
VDTAGAAHWEPVPEFVGTDAEGPMKQLIMAIVQSLVDKPEEVQIKEVVGSAIRTLMAATSGKEKKRYILEIIEH